VTRISGDQKRFRCGSHFEKRRVPGVGKLDGQWSRSNRIGDRTDQFQKHGGIFGNDSQLRALQHAVVLRQNAVVGVQLESVIGKQVDDLGA